MRGDRKVQELLAGKLELATELDPSSPDYAADSIFLRSTAPLRDSKILPGGWREAFDFDVHFKKATGKVLIKGSAHPLVSRQALGSLASYTGLNDAQRNVYTSFLDSSVSEAIKTACKRFAKIDSKSLSCD